MIQSFADKETERLFRREKSKKFSSGIERIALRKLTMVEAAVTIEDLRIPPANHLEKLRGDHEGLHSIRINDQWRVCFRWSEGNAHDVKITDYH